ncbi:AMP-dependent synthetase and ligase [Desulfovibrio sp. X2]|uniref:DVU_1553 family AMP-dependent CoA ligase n=1 Tax=Desulfovibrio sp. X2 TaxID=941449 RepID=UPI0003588ACF|nr:AMP-binding protein [Desulfovibrio sp. X2]EPR41250.1 AMP-dependent synthetase and ligase [Desulfovibrio sp. X2]
MTFFPSLDAWVAERSGVSGPNGAPDPAALAAWQLAALRATLAWAREKSPFYRNHLASLPPNFPRTPEEVAQIPFTTPDDLREAGEHMLCVPQGAVARVVTISTSGTTGGPKRIFLTDEDVAATLDFFSQGMTMLARPGDAVLVLLPGRTPDGASDLLARATARMGARPLFAPEGCSPAETARLLIDAGISCVAALPRQAAALMADPSARQAGKGRVRTMLLSGEPVADELRAAVADAWGAEIFAHYGQTETGFGGGVECLAHQGYHLREADLFFEIVDPESGLPLGQNALGEVVVSTLLRRGMPLIRFRTGDAARMLAGPCACGSPLRRLGAVQGRIVRDAAGTRIIQPEKGAGRRGRPSFDP